MNLLEQLRTEVGLPMGSWYEQTERVERREVDGREVVERVTTQAFLGWTTDKRKADQARDLGATVIPCSQASGAYAGWEIRVVQVTGRYPVGGDGHAALGPVTT